MKKENVIILIIVAFIVGFIAGGIGGIKFYATHMEGVRSTGIIETDPHATAAPDLKALEDIVRKEPTNLTALVDLGNAYFDANQYPQAIETYKKAIALDPKNADVRTDLGIMYRAIKDYDGAIQEFKEAIKENPKHVNSRFNLGIVLQMDKKDISGAIAAWEDFLKIEPTGKQADMARAQLKQLKELSK
jgi:tetratricopeptide (TPR) repeat protein